jgi:hypothetical protein
MKHVHVLQILAEIFPFVRAQYPQGKTNQRPQVDGLPRVVPRFGQFVYLSVAVVASGHAIVGAGGENLVRFHIAVGSTGIPVSGLEKTSASAATKIVRPVGNHVDEVFFPHDRLDYKAKIFRYGVSIAFPHDLAWILDRELYFTILVPVRIYGKFSFPDPFRVIFVDALDLEFVFDAEFFQSCQD